MTTRITLGLLAAVFVGFAVGRMTITRPAYAEVETDARPVPTWPVLSVDDGDMFNFKYRPPVPMEMRARLLNVDTPNRDDQAGHKAAREALASMVYGKDVRIEFEKPGKPRALRGGLLLVYAFVGDKCVNVELVRQGMSKYITRFGEGRLAEPFKAAEAEAKAAQRGVWAE